MAHGDSRCNGDSVASPQGLSLLLDALSSEPLRRTILSMTSNFDLWSTPRSAVRLLGLCGVSLRLHLPEVAPTIVELSFSAVLFLTFLPLASTLGNVDCWSSYWLSAHFLCPFLLGSSSSFELDVVLCSVSVIPLQHRSCSICMSFRQAGPPKRVRLLDSKVGSRINRLSQGTATRYRIGSRTKVLQPFDYYYLSEVVK